MHIRRLSLLLLAAAAALPQTALANERHFAWTYETGVLPAGTAELEPWTTWRVGRESYFSRFDHRIEFEYGITDRLQTALYFNFRGVARRDGNGPIATSFDYQGISSEWKLKLLDAVADPIGLGLYGEIGLAPDEFELELKILFDKRIGDLLFAANVVFEPEMEIGSVEEPAMSGMYEIEREIEYVGEVDLALGYFVSEHAMIGLEIRNHTELPDGEFEHSAFFAGPTFSYATEGYWVAVSVLPQVLAITADHAHEAGAAAEEEEGLLDLEEHEYVNARVLLGFHL